MKIPLVTDLHFGARGNSEFFDRQFRKFYSEQFFPYIDKVKPDFMICLGDTFDDRKRISTEILQNCKEYFFTEIEKRDISLFLIVGNHDAFFKNTLSVNTPRVTLSEYKNIVVVDRPEVYRFGKANILLMPWICADNAEESMKLLENANAEYCFGHFEIEGFKMHKNVESHGGFSPIMFNKFKKVLSGHYHTRSTKGHITYLGINTQHSWADYDDPKGFHLFDTDTGDLEFVQNPDDIFVRIDYNEGLKEVPNLKDKIVRIYTTVIEDQTKFDRYIKKIQDTNPEDLKIVDQASVMKVEEGDEEIQVEDTGAVLSAYVDSIDESLKEQKLDKNILKKLMASVYKEASEL